jgi:hypothetical protein
MSRPPLLAAFAGLALLAACGDGPKPGGTGAAGVGSSPPVRSGTVDTELARQQKLVEEQVAARDKMARGLLASFESRVYDPRRDHFLEHAEGTVEVKTSSGEAKYKFVFDASFPEERPVRFEAMSEPASIDKRTVSEVRNWAHLTCLGAYPVVCYYRPPIALDVVPGVNPDHTIVLVPIYKSEMSVSYSLDKRQVVIGRAEWTGPEHKYVTNYDWDPYGGGRFLLRRAVLYQGSTTDFDYADRDGFRVLDRVHVKDDTRPIEAVFSYQTLRRRVP